MGDKRSPVPFSLNDDEPHELGLASLSEVTPLIATGKERGSRKPKRAALERILGLEVEDTLDDDPPAVNDRPTPLLSSIALIDDDGYEIITVEQESSDEEDEKGHDTEHSWTEVEEVLALSDSEKLSVDYLTGVIPDEVLRKIYGYLDPVTMDRTATVCKRTNGLLQEKLTWKPYLDDWIFVGMDKVKKARTRADFAALYNQEMRARQREKERLERLAHEAFLRATSSYAKKIMTFLFFNRSVDYLTLFAFILGTCFFALRMQEIILWPWRVVLVPLYIPLFQFFISTTVYDISRWYFTKENVHEVTESDIAFWHIFIARIDPHRPLIHLLNLTFLSFWILLMVKMNQNMNGIPAGIVIIPWLVLFLGVFLEQIFGWSSGVPWWDRPVFLDARRSHGADRIYMVLASMTLSLQALFVAFQLDGVVSWEWRIVFIPAFVFLGGSVVYSLVALFCATCFVAMRNSIRIVERGSGLAAVVTLGVISVGVVTPLLIFFALAAVNLDGFAHRNWPIIFVPIFVIQGAILIGCLSVDFFIWRRH